MSSSKMRSSRHRTLSSWSVCSLLVLLLFTACSAEQGSSSSLSSAKQQPTRQASPDLSPVAQQPTQQTSPGPSPVTALLAPAPQHCPSGSSLDSRVFPQFSSDSLTGRGSVWELGLPPNATLHLNDLGYTQWPLTKIVWPTHLPNFPNTVTVRVTNLSTGTEAWWDIGEGAPPPNKPVRPLILGPTGNRSAGVWGTLLYLPQAGCYQMTVSWPSGQWRLLFAVGR